MICIQKISFSKYIKIINRIPSKIYNNSNICFKLEKFNYILVIANDEDKFKVLKKILSGDMQKCYLSKLINIYKGRIKLFYVN